MTWTDQVGELCFAAIKNDRKGWERMNPTESAGCISFQMVLSQFFFFFFFLFFFYFTFPHKRGIQTSNLRLMRRGPQPIELPLRDGFKSMLCLILR
jgi:hypothetical protein